MVPGCAGSVRPSPMPGIVNVPVNTPPLCVNAYVDPKRTAGPDVMRHDPVMLPTVNVTELFALPPLLSVTVTVPLPLNPFVNNAD